MGFTTRFTVSQRFNVSRSQFQHCIFWQRFTPFYVKGLHPASLGLLLRVYLTNGGAEQTVICCACDRLIPDRTRSHAHHCIGTRKYPKVPWRRVEASPRGHSCAVCRFRHHSQHTLVLGGKAGRSGTGGVASDRNVRRHTQRYETGECCVFQSAPRPDVTSVLLCVELCRHRLGGYATGFIFFHFRIPERWAPGYFDVVGHSHQWVRCHPSCSRCSSTTCLKQFKC